MRAQLLDCRIPGVDAMLFTHAHADHITGLDDVRILNRIANRPLPAFATAETLDEMTQPLRLRVQAVGAPGVLSSCSCGDFRSRHGDTVEAAGLRVQVFNQNHGRVETLGLRIGDFGYSTDVVALDDAAFAALEGVDTWVVGCFLRQGPHWTHADLTTVLAWVERLRPRRTVLTHMGTDMDWAWMQATSAAGHRGGLRRDDSGRAVTGVVT